MDQLCAAIDDLTKVVRAEARSAVTDFLDGRLAGRLRTDRPKKSGPRDEGGFGAVGHRSSPDRRPGAGSAWRPAGRTDRGAPPPAGDQRRRHPAARRHQRGGPNPVPGALQPGRRLSAATAAPDGRPGRRAVRMCRLPGRPDARRATSRCSGGRPSALSAYNSDVRRAARWQAYHQANADYIDAVRREIAERGPLTASRLTTRGGVPASGGSAAAMAAGPWSSCSTWGSWAPGEPRASNGFTTWSNGSSRHRSSPCRPRAPMTPSGPWCWRRPRPSASAPRPTWLATTCSSRP